MYAGGLSEKRATDDVAVGPTFACLIMNQFKDLKNGDRFYYENSPTVNPAAFTPGRKKSLISIDFLLNYDLSLIQENPFFDVTIE